MFIFLSHIHFVFAFLLGVAIGSFLNVVVLRREKEEAVTGRSHCMHCGKVLRWYELVPVLSYVKQMGRCTGCKEKLSVQYPLVELITGILFTLVVGALFGRVGSAVTLGMPTGLELVLHWTIWSLFIAITVYDIRTKLIPDVFSYTLAVSAFALLFVQGGVFMLPSYVEILAGPFLFLPFYLLWKVSDGHWLGLGDGKLALGIGWFLGLSLGGTAIMFAFWIGAVVSVGIIAFQKFTQSLQGKRVGEQLTLKSEIPFGPFLVLGALIVYLTHVNLFAQLL